MTFVLDAMHLEVLEGYAKVEETALVIYLDNTSGRNITFSKVSTVAGKIVSFPPVTIFHGNTLTINADATHFGWVHGDTIHWCIAYSVDNPVLYLTKM